MRDLLRLLRLFRPYWGWIALGVLLSFATLLANVGLMTISGWFITAMAIAGVAGVSMNYFTPAAIIRFFAIVRTVGRYLERLVTHEATFRMLATLRRWFYEHLEPLAPADLQHFRSGDLLSRIRADIDTLENFYLGILAPLLVAFFGSIAFIFFLGGFHPLMGLIELILLLFAGVIIPAIIAKLANVPGKNKVQTASELRATTVDGLQGMGELLVYGAAENHAMQMNALSKKLIRDQRQMARYTGISQGVMILCANLAMIGVLIIAISMVNQERLSPPYLTMLALFALASFEAILPLPLALQSLGETLAAARRIFSIVDTEPEVKDPSEEPPTPDACAIRLQSVSFS
jgi:ATP-binding cassette subfamily C protein CydC